MSLAAVRWSLDVRASCRLRHLERLVLVALVDHTATDGTDCWPAQSTIAELLDVNVRSVRRAVAALEDLGLVVKVRRRRLRSGALGTWEYRLPVDNGTSYRAPVSATTTAHQRPVGDQSYRAPATDLARTSVRAEALGSEATTRARARTRGTGAVDNGDRAPDDERARVLAANAEFLERFRAGEHRERKDLE